MDNEYFKKLLEQGESSWLDWKRDFPAGLIGGSKGPDWEQGKAELLKDLVSIANSDDERTGFLVYGVEDQGTHRELIGISSNWNDAMFQTWAQNAFDPLPQFLYRELAYEKSKTVGIFSVEHSPDYPHVVSQNPDRVIFEGQVWYRVGTKNTVAGHQKLREMFLGQEPFELEGLGGPIFDRVKQHYEGQGRTEQWRRYGERHDLIEKGFSLAYSPGTRRYVIVVNLRNERDSILMVRP